MAYRMPLAPPVLVGLAIDVSGSMRQSFDNQSGSSTSHISEFRVALDRSMDRVRAKILDASGEPDSDAPSSLVFVYAYGLSRDPGIIDLLAMLDDPRTFAALTLADTIREVVTPEYLKKLKDFYQSKYKAETFVNPFGRMDRLGDAMIGGGEMAAREIRNQIVRHVTQETGKRLREQRIDEDPSELINRLADPVARLIRADRWDEIRNVVESGLRSEIGTYDRTMTLTDLARRWKNTEEFFDSSNESLFGSTPMRECLERIAERFRRESAGRPPGLLKILILVTDGRPTDGDIGPAVCKLKSFGVRIVSCFVADSDQVVLKHLYATPQPHWTGPTRLMFESASVIDDDRLFGELLQAQGWEIDQGARFFIQANHSELLEEFFSSAFERAKKPAMSRPIEGVGPS